MQIQLVLINGTFHVHKAGCADLARKRRPFDNQPQPPEEHDSQESVIASAWTDIIREYEGERDYAIKQGTSPAQARADFEALMSSLAAETSFKPCTRDLPEHPPALAAPEGQDAEKLAAAQAERAVLIEQAERHHAENVAAEERRHSAELQHIDHVYELRTGKA